MAYEREAYFSTKDENFRLTFDFNIKTREHDVSFLESKADREVLPDDYVLLEVKTVMGLPIWILEFLNENKIYKTSFSKYGTAYQLYYLPQFIHSLGRKTNV